MTTTAILSDEELTMLGNSLAYEHATGLIESECMHRLDATGGDWWQLPSTHELEDVLRDLNDSVRYLEVRGLLEHHSETPEWVMLFDESEATR